MTKFEYLQSVYDYGMAIANSKFPEHRPFKRIKGAVLYMARSGYSVVNDNYTYLVLISGKDYRTLLSSRIDYDLDIDCLDAVAAIEALLPKTE